MKAIYDAEVDILRLLFSRGRIEESDEGNPGMIIDYDRHGNIVGLEILDASKRVEIPDPLNMRLLGDKSESAARG